LLLLTLPMTGCLTASTAPVKASAADLQIAAGVCRAWTGLSYDSKHDTQPTILAARKLNRARAAYCK
jgi:hypothetical protein